MSLREMMKTKKREEEKQWRRDREESEGELRPNNNYMILLGLKCKYPFGIWVQM